MDDGGDTVGGDGDQDDRHGEEKAQGDLPLGLHGRAKDDRDRESDQQEICHNVAAAHRDDLREAGPAVRAWVGSDLPVVGDGMAFTQRGSDDTYKSQDEKDADAVQDCLVAFGPDVLGKALEVFGYGELGYPYAVSF